MKSFINKILSRHSKYTIDSLKESIINKLPDVKYFLVDLPIELYRDYCYYIITILSILALIIGINPYITIGTSTIITTLTLIYQHLSFKRDVVNMSMPIDAPMKELEQLINECLTEYLLFNSYEGKAYINSDEEDKIRSAVADMIAAKLSDTLYKKLCIRYKESAVYNIVGMTITVKVMEFVINNNKTTGQKEETTPSTSSTIGIIPKL